MKSWFWTGIVTLLLLSGGCAQEVPGTIPPGVYRASESEFLRVDNDTIDFNVQAKSGNRTWIVRKKLDYSFWKNESMPKEYMGMHVSGGSSNDTDYIYGIATYRWFWDGQNVVRTSSVLWDYPNVCTRRVTRLN